MTRLTTVTVRLFLLALLSYCTTRCGVARAQSIPTVETIVAAWQARQDRTRSARFQWHETRSSGEEVALKLRRLKTTEERKEFLRTASLEPVTRERTIAVSFDGEMIRCSREGEAWIDSLGEFKPRSYVGVCDGEVAKSFFGPDESPREAFHGRGTIFNKVRLLDYDDMTIRPILLTYRALCPNLIAFTPSLCKVRPKRAVVGDRSCVVLEQASAGPSSPRRAYWVDPDRNYVVLQIDQYAFQEENTVVFRVGISYQNDATHAAVPSGWRAIAFNNAGKPAMEFTAKVSRYEINVEIPRTEFQLDFPPGTRVADRRGPSDRAWIESDTSHYIVREDETKRFISLRERQARIDNDRLMVTETNEDLPTPRGSRRLLLVWTLTGVLLVGAWGLYRWRRAGRSP